MVDQSVRLAALVERLGGELIGDADVQIRQVASLRQAGPHDIAFYNRGPYADDLRATQAGAVILAPDDAAASARARIVVANPYLYFARVSQWLNPPAATVAGIDRDACVDPTAIIAASAAVAAGAVIGARTRIAAGAFIGPGCVVGADCTIDADTRLVARVTLYSHTAVGARVIIHAGAVLGADGFGFANDHGTWVKIPQIGRVIVGDDVEIGANTTIDRGALDATVIETGVKLDNQIQIGHNCHIGAHTAIAGCVGIAGSTRIGKFCMIGGAAQISGHLTIVDSVVIAGGTGVSNSITKSGSYAGVFPFTEKKRWQRIAVQLRNIETLVARVKALERAIGVTTTRRDGDDQKI